MVPDSWYSWYHYSHPPLVERLRVIQRRDKETPAAKAKAEAKVKPIKCEDAAEEDNKQEKKAPEEAQQSPKQKQSPRLKQKKEAKKTK